MSMLGPISTLRRYHDEAWEADFLAGVPPGMSLSRASTANYVDSQGAIRTAGVDEARFEFDPQTGRPKGLLFEGAGTNLFNTHLFPTSGNDGSSAITVNADFAPDGTKTATKIMPTAAAIAGAKKYYVYYNLATVVGTTYTRSHYVKPGPGVTVIIGELYQDANGSWSYDLISGAIVKAATSTLTVTKFANGWYRFAITWTASFAATAHIFGARGTDTTIDSYCLLWGRQLELGGTCTSLMPITGGTATRAADAASFSTPWYANSFGGTLYSEVDLSAGGLAGSNSALAVALTAAAAGTSYMQMQLVSSNKSAQFTVATNSVNQYGRGAVFADAFDGRRTVKMAIQMDAALGGSGAVDGTPMSAPSLLSLPTLINTLSLKISGAGAVYFRNLRYWKKRIDVAAFTKR